MIFLQEVGGAADYTYAGDAARVTKNGAVVVGWTSGGTLSGIPVGDGYQIEINTGGKIATDALSVGEVVLAIGQSNMVGWFEGPSVPASAPGAYAWRGGQWVAATGDGALTFAKVVTQGDKGDPVAFVDAAVYGTALLAQDARGGPYWSDPSASGLTAVAAGLLHAAGGHARFIIWNQGEADLASTTTADAYASALGGVVSAIRASDTVDDVLVSGLKPGGDDNVYRDVVVAGQMQYVATHSGATFIPTPSTFDTVDGFHLTGASRTWQGEDVAKAALNDLGHTQSTFTEVAATASDDSITLTGQGSHRIDAGLGDDSIQGGPGGDLIRGEAGADVLTGGAGVNTLSGGDGNDLVINTGQASEIYGDGGADTLRAGGHGDLVYGGSEADSLVGGHGSDTLDGGSGGDTLQGGAGDDVYYVDDPADVVLEDANQGYDKEFVSVDGLSLAANVERGQLLGGFKSLGGNNLDNYLLGNSYTNVLSGYGGDDTLEGTAGPDTLIGGTGNDTYVVISAAQVVVENADEGFDTIRTAIQKYTLAANVEALTYTGTLGFIGTGNGLADVITGSSGGDFLDGGGGASTLVGGLGSDTYVVRNPGAVVVELADQGTDSVTSYASVYTLPIHVERLSYAGTSSFTGIGNAAGGQINGGSGDDTLDDGGGASTLNAGAGDDTYIVRNIKTTILEVTSGGTDTVRTTLAAYILSASLENLAFIGSGAFSGAGNAHANAITGGAGNDTLNGAGGADTLTGSEGDDTYIVNNAGVQVVETASGGNDTVVTSLLSFALPANVETLIYSGAGGFTGSGGASDNRIVGGSGNDTITGGAGNDELDGKGGTNTAVYAGPMSRYVVYGDGAGGFFVLDGLSGGGPDGLDHLHSIATLQFGDRTITAAATSGAHVLAGTASDDVIAGSTGDDIVAGFGGGDRIDGGGGNDTALYAGPASAYAEYADGSGGLYVQTLASGANLALFDHLTHIHTLRFSDVAVATAGLGAALYLQGGPGADTLNGGPGDDLLSGGGGDDVLNGGAGTDTACYVGSAGRYTVTPDGTGGYFVADSVAASAGGDGRDHLLNVELLRFDGGSVGIDGLATGAAFTGTAAADSIVGGGGADTLDGGAGADTLVGGAGADTYYVDNAKDVVVEQVGGGFDTVYATGSWTATAGSEIERVVVSGTGAVNLTGNGFAMEIDGNAANNALADGGAGDLLAGGAGNDSFTVTNAATVVVELANGGYDGVRTTLNGYVLPDQVETLAFMGTGAFTGVGNGLANYLTGGDGNDTLDGGAGADRMVGGKGDDTYYVDNLGDAVVENPGEGRDTVLTTLSSFIAPVNVEVMAYVGSAGFVGYAKDTAISMIGGAGNDGLVGGAGNDTFVGGGGNDNFTGKGGADTFALNGPGAGYDRIVDFAHGVDVVRLGAAAFGIGDLSTVAFVNGSASQPGQPALVYDAAGKLYWDPHGADPAHQILVATFDNHPTLTLADFIIG